MARPLRIEYPGARYHMVSRGERRKPIFADRSDRLAFLQILGEACAKTGWQVHAYCLMTNHFHAVVETPQPNLAMGMRWLLGTYTQGFNRRHGRSGHLFGDRYKTQLIDERGGSYLAQASAYVHLNPKRANLLGARASLESYPWSSYPAYLRPELRSPWLRVDRVLGENGLPSDNTKSRKEFARKMEAICPVDLAGEDKPLRRGWKLGGEDFRDRLAAKLARREPSGERAITNNETDAARAERMVRKALAAVRWHEADLARRPKGHSTKVKIAQALRRETPMDRQWIANRLKMGSAGYVSNLLASVDSKP